MRLQHVSSYGSAQLVAWMWVAVEDGGIKHHSEVGVEAERRESAAVLGGA